MEILCACVRVHVRVCMKGEREGGITKSIGKSVSLGNEKGVTQRKECLE